MTWFVLAVLVALGGIFAAYKRSKSKPPVTKNDKTKDP
jgi:hypothetical protein